MGLTGFVRVLLGFTGFVRVLLGLTWSFRVLEWAKLPTCIRAWKGSGTQHFSRIWRAVPCCLFFFDNFFVVFFFTASRAKEQRTSEPTNPPASATNDEGKELINKWIIKGKKKGKDKTLVPRHSTVKAIFFRGSFPTCPNVVRSQVFIFIFWVYSFVEPRHFAECLSHGSTAWSSAYFFLFFANLFLFCVYLLG